MYAKVFAQIYDGTLCTNGPWEALVTFQQLLVLADKDGVVDMTAKAISRRTTIPLEIIEVGIAALLLPDPDSRTPVEDGRRIMPLSADRDWGWVVVNYKHYRQIKREEDRREYHREYWHKRKTQHETQQTQQTQPNQPIAEAKAYAHTSSSLRSEDKAPTARFDPKAHLMAKGIDGPLAADWITLRRAKKAPPTEAAITGIEREADKARITLADALSLCCQRGWAGFKSEWALQAPAGGNSRGLARHDQQMDTMSALTGGRFGSGMFDKKDKPVAARPALIEQKAV